MNNLTSQEIQYVTHWFNERDKQQGGTLNEAIVEYDKTFYEVYRRDGKLDIRKVTDSVSAAITRVAKAKRGM